MGTELALKLVDDHSLTVWNRTAEKTTPLVERGARAAETPEEAVKGADLVITSLFGPDTVREVVIEPSLIPEGVTWADSTTISPEVAAEFAAAVPATSTPRWSARCRPPAQASWASTSAEPMLLDEPPSPKSSPPGPPPTRSV